MNTLARLSIKKFLQQFQLKYINLQECQKHQAASDSFFEPYRKCTKSNGCFINKLFLQEQHPKMKRLKKHAGVSEYAR